MDIHEQRKFVGMAFSALPGVLAARLCQTKDVQKLNLNISEKHCVMGVVPLLPFATSNDIQFRLKDIQIQPVWR
jgi:hypothetical protein